MRRRAALVVVHTDLAQQWAHTINRTMGEAVGAVIATGHAFLKAKKDLHHGGFQRLFADHPEHIVDPVRCTRRTAQMYMAVAMHPWLSDAKHASHLPSAWTTLYELTKVPRATLERALTDGRIHPGIERKHVGRLRGAPKRPAKKSPVVQVGSPVARFSREAQHAIDTLPLDDAEALLEQVEALVVILKKRLAAREET